MSLDIFTNFPPRYRPLADLVGGFMVPPAVLSARWNTSTQTLANWRSTGKGLPATRLSGGAIRYRVAEILAAEMAGTHGPLSVDRVALELSVMPDVPADLAAKIVERLKAAMAEQPK
jgi:hypothetical protein